MAETCLFLCGDVMTGRGIDQILPHPVDPVLYESYVQSARGYVELAEKRNGHIESPVDYAYIWGDALAEWRRMHPHACIVNLETAVTTSDEWLPKGINYRMHPDNLECLTAAKIDCCVLANNHVLDWGVSGLLETLSALRSVIPSAGAGEDAERAASPAVLPVPDRRVIVFGAGAISSGIPGDWAASRGRAGVNFLPDLSPATIGKIEKQVSAAREANDIVVFSIHWGGNWGYAIPGQHRDFAHALIDTAGVDMVHGHSSHHPLGIEVYHGKPILYGCGDFINDYEGIGGHEAYRGDLTLMYFAVFGTCGELLRLTMSPMQIRQLSLHRASPEDAEWLRGRLSSEGEKLNTRVSRNPDDRLELHWGSAL